jgi:delta 1-pyrroline-5-carboxylate dehydrogenase
MNLALTPGVPFFAPPPPTGAGVDDGVANVSSRPSLPREGQTVAGHVSERIPADLSEAFDQAVNAVIAWDSAGEEPTVAVYGRPVLVSVIASLCETYKDVMPTKLYWRVVRHANRSLERRA